MRSDVKVTEKTASVRMVARKGPVECEVSRRTLDKHSGPHGIREEQTARLVVPTVGDPCALGLGR